MGNHVCPWYLGYILANPLRRWYQDPEKILGPYIVPGMNILEIGPGMGFFSLPMATLAGEHGRIVCVDLQEKMLRNLERRASKNQLLTRMELRRCSESSLQIDDLAGSIDFALAFAVVHEVPDQNNLLREIISSLKQQGRLLISEPQGHVSPQSFTTTVAIALGYGMIREDSPKINGNHSVLLKKI